MLTSGKASWRLELRLRKGRDVWEKQGRKGRFLGLRWASPFSCTSSFHGRRCAKVNLYIMEKYFGRDETGLAPHPGRVCLVDNFTFRKTASSTLQHDQNETNASEKYIILPETPASVILVEPKGTSTSSASMPGIFETPRIKCSPSASHKSGFHSGIRSAIIPEGSNLIRLKGMSEFNLKLLKLLPGRCSAAPKTPISTHFSFILTGCGNMYEGFKLIPVDTHPNSVQLRGCMFENTCYRELYITGKVGQLLEAHSLPWANKPVGPSLTPNPR